ncbi:hypothetical protein D3C87_1354390 [compost metagenome]
MSIERVRPVAQARGCLQAITAGDILLLTAADVQLFAHNHTVAAAFRLIMKLADLRIALGVLRHQRHHRVFQTVVNRLQLPRAATFTGAQRRALRQESGPLITLARSKVTVACIRKVDQRHSLIAGQQDHGFAQELSIDFDSNSQWNIKKEFMKLCRQTFSLLEQTYGLVRRLAFTGKRACAKNKRKRSCDRSHRKH